MARTREEEKEERKRPVAHNAAIELLRENPRAHLLTIAALYGKGTVVPAEGIRGLVEALETARAQVDSNASKAIEALTEQAKEVREKEG